MFEGTGGVGNAFVVTTNNRGMSSDEWVELAINKILSISESAPMPIREQAIAYRENIKYVLGFYFKKVAKSERNTIAAKLRSEGHSHIADKIEDLY